MVQKYLYQCEDCGTRFYLGPDGVELHYGVHYKTKDGRSIWITYYDCLKCGRRHYVQVDDTRSYQMKKETEVMFRKLSKKRLNFKDIPKKQNEKFKKLNDSLEDYRFELKKELNNKVVISDDGKEVELHFSM